VAPAGLRIEDVGRPRSVAAGAAVARVTRAPGARSRRPQAPFRPDLVVIAPVGIPVVHPTDSLELEASGVPHLLAGVRETTGIIGPLVAPGRTSCLHCQHLHRNHLDAAWPLLALQMSRRSEAHPDPCEITLATFVAAMAAMQALEFVDSGCRRDSRQRRRDPGDLDDREAIVQARFLAPPEADSDGVEPASEKVGPDEEALRVGAWEADRLPPTADGTLELAVPDWRIRRRSWPVHPECPCRSSRARAMEQGEQGAQREQREQGEKGVDPFTNTGDPGTCASRSSQIGFRTYEIADLRDPGPMGSASGSTRSAPGSMRSALPIPQEPRARQTMIAPPLAP
jgi:hypothetical protein